MSSVLSLDVSAVPGDPDPQGADTLYFDYAATTPVDEQVIARMVDCLGRHGAFGNPASGSHPFGRRARALVEHARRQVADLVGAEPAQLIWTSGATESNNLALKGVIRARPGGHVISSRLEHKAVLDTLRQMEGEGVAVTYLAPDRNGEITVEAVQRALREDTFLVSLMLVNNELGSVTDVHGIGQIARGHGALLHVDAAQATGKVVIDLRGMAVDLMSFSAHKTYGPKGIGALYVGERARGRLHAQMHGGGHEHGLRSGTLATHQIVGMGEAFALAAACARREHTGIAALRERLLRGLEGLPIELNGRFSARVPHTLSLTPEHELSLGAELALSSTSACNSASNAPSHVLLALGLSPAAALRTIRLSLGRFTTAQEVDRAVQLIRGALRRD